MLTGLQRGSDGEQWVVSVDSTSVRAHHHAAGAPKAAPADVTAERLAVFLSEVAEPVEDGAEPAGDTGGGVESQEIAG